MREIKQRSAPVINFFVAQPDGFFSSQALGSSLLHGQGVTGLLTADFTIYVAKNGAAFGTQINPTPTVTTVGNGWYSFTLAAGYTDTLGELIIHVSTISYPQVEQIYNVVANIESDISTLIGSPVALDGGSATVAGMLTKMADDNGGLDFNAATDSLTEIAATQALAPPSLNVAVNGGVDTGNQVGGTWEDTKIDGSVWWNIQPVGTSGSAQMICHLNYTTPTPSHIPVTLIIKGYYKGGGGASTAEWMDIYIYNYHTTSYDKLSGITSSTRMMHATTDQTYEFGLNSEHIDPATGNMIIRFVGTSNFETGAQVDNLYLNYVAVETTVSQSITPDEIADAVWSRRISSYTTLGSAGSILYYGTGIVARGTILAVTDIRTFLGDHVPPSVNCWNDHMLIVKHVISGSGYVSCVPLSSVSAVGLLTAEEDLYEMPQVGDHWAVVAETSLGHVMPEASEELQESIWDTPIGDHTTDNTTGKTVYTLASKFPADYLMGSATTGSKDGVIDAIDAITSQFTFGTEGVIAEVNGLVNTASSVSVVKDDPFFIQVLIRDFQADIPATVAGYFVIKRNDGAAQCYWKAATGEWVDSLAPGEGANNVTVLTTYNVTTGLWTYIWSPDTSVDCTFIIVLTNIRYVNTINISVVDYRADAVQDAILDEDVTVHTTADSVGEALNDIKAITDQITFDVGDGGINSHGLNAPVIDYDAIADHVWDEPIADHQDPGSTGEALDESVDLYALEDNT